VAEWTAELTVDEDLARRLIGEQFADLTARSARLLAEGWDNTVWLIDETWGLPLSGARDRGPAGRA
jgi:hypothetical protein